MSHTVYFYILDEIRYIGILDNLEEPDEKLFNQLPEKLECSKITFKISLNSPVNTYGENSCEYLLTREQDNYILYEFDSEINFETMSSQIFCHKFVLPPKKMTSTDITNYITNSMHIEHPITPEKEVKEWCIQNYSKNWEELRLIDQKILREIYIKRRKIINTIPEYEPSLVDIWAYQKILCFCSEKGQKKKVEADEIIKRYGSLNFLYDKYNSIHKYTSSPWWKISEKIHKKKMCPVHIFSASSFTREIDKPVCLVCGNEVFITFENEEKPEDCLCRIRYNSDNFYLVKILYQK